MVTRGREVDLLAGEGTGGAGSLWPWFSAPCVSCPQLQVKSAGLLDKRKGLELEEMRADSKPLCTTFQGKSTNIRSVVSSVTPGSLIYT